MTKRRFLGNFQGNMLVSIRDKNSNKNVNIIQIVEIANQLYNENEQLKQALRDYHNAFDCSQCRYQNYDWFSDGDEFEICDKGNNEAQMEYHSCKDWEELD